MALIGQQPVCGWMPHERMMSCLFKISPVRDTPLFCMFTSETLWPRSITAAVCKKNCVALLANIAIAVGPTFFNWLPVLLFSQLDINKTLCSDRLWPLLLYRALSATLIHWTWLRICYFVAADVCLKHISDTSTGDGSSKPQRRQQCWVMVWGE